MSIAAYEAKFRALSRYSTQLCFSPQERICRFVKGLRLDLQIPALQVSTAAKSFQEVVDFVIEVERVKPDDFTMASATKKFRKGGEFSGSYSRGQSSGGYPARPIQSSLQAVAGVHRRPINISLSLEVIPRLRRSHRDLCLTPESVMDVGRLDILRGIVQNRVTNPQ